jgi:hypothetical protein
LLRRLVRVVGQLEEDHTRGIINGCSTVRCCDMRYRTGSDVAAPLVLLRNPARERSSEVNGAMAAGRLAWNRRLVWKRTRCAARDAQQEGLNA